MKTNNFKNMAKKYVLPDIVAFYNLITSQNNYNNIIIKTV